MGAFSLIVVINLLNRFIYQAQKSEVLDNSSFVKSDKNSTMSESRSVKRSDVKINRIVLKILILTAIISVLLNLVLMCIMADVYLDCNIASNIFCSVNIHSFVNGIWSMPMS